MVFSSLIFLWIFLPIVLGGYFLMPQKFKNIFLLFASLIFYAWGEGRYIALLLISISVNYVIGRLMAKYNGIKKLLLLFGILFNLGLLGYFKYFNFLIGIVKSFHKTDIEVAEVALPIGISFFTFQILSYVIDVYCGKCEVQKNFVNLALYISFFPQLIAGPIVKYGDIQKQLDHRKCTIENMAKGIRRFSYGLGKKIILANTFALCVDKIYALDYGELTGALAWIAAVLYCMQIYYDFSGYSDMAIGLGKMFGFEFRENFAYPYLSASIHEFWQRWHISLGAWFREYLYFPLGGSRRGPARTYWNLMIVFLVTGFWHGASFTFIVWGMYHGFFQIVERMGFHKILSKHKIFARLYTISVVLFGWVLFRAKSLSQAGEMFKRMLMPWRYTESSMTLRILLGNKTLLLICGGILGCGLIQLLLQKTGGYEKGKYSYPEMIYCVAVFVLCIAMLASNTYNPFIYFRF